MGKDRRDEPLEDFLARALPKKRFPWQKPHALTLGEYHRDTGHLGYFTKRIDALKSDNNLGGIGYELAPFMEVFLWAYRDKVPGIDKAYVRRMFQASVYLEFYENAAAKTNMMMKAIDSSLPCICFDSRKPYLGVVDSEKESIVKYQKMLSENPELRNGLLGSSDSDFSKIDRKIRLGFLFTELQGLLDKCPKYQGHLDNIEAVMEAQRTLMQEGKPIGFDATSAAILAARLPEEKNVLALIGKAHVTGVVWEDKGCEGTFAQHLSSHLKNTTAVVSNRREVAKRLLSNASDIPASIPTLDTAHATAYHFDKSNSKDTPFPTAANKAEVAESAKNMQDPRMQRALERLRNDNPWAARLENSRSQHSHHSERG